MEFKVKDIIYINLEITTVTKENKNQTLANFIFKHDHIFFNFNHKLQGFLFISTYARYLNI